MLGSLRHSLRAQSQGHHTIDRLERREALKEEALELEIFLAELRSCVKVEVTVLGSRP